MNGPITTEETYHVSNILKHYAHAREKHPYFCDRLLPIDLETVTPEDVIDFRKATSQMLSSSRDNIRARIKDGDLTYSDVVGCELWEVDEAIANNDKAHAIEELYDTIAVCLRTIDVLEGRQKLGKPEMNNPPPRSTRQKN